MDPSLKETIKSYKPSAKAVDILRRQRLVIFAGVSSAGKNTIMNKLLATGKYHDIVTSTTREPRENNGIMERDGVDYHFLTTEQALAKLQAGEYIEVASVHERINGVLVSELEKAEAAGKIPIIDVDVQGVKTFKKLSDDVIAIFVVPPTFEEWLSRMKKRYDTLEEFEEVWPVRRQSALMELEEVLHEPYYHFIVNEDLNQAVNSAEKIITSGDVFSQEDIRYRALVEDLLAELKARP